MLAINILTISVVALAAPVYSWGTLGHKTVANVAIHYLKPATLTAVSAVLAADPYKSTPNPTLVDVANWADTYRYTTPGKFSAGYHYVDANDNPPTSCNVDVARDCTGGCVITAIANYTQRVQDGRLSAQHTAEALKFLVHFLGDITQPLHDEEYKVGGNGVPVLFGGVATNLHSIWDTNMITKLVGADNDADLTAWTNTIVTQITGGIYQSAIPSWLSCSDITKAQICATAWATDANALDCSYVLNPIPADNAELSGAYYNGAAPIIQQQIAKAGVRLAAWLNKIYTGSTGF